MNLQGLTENVEHWFVQEVLCLYKYPCKGHMKSYVKSDARFLMEHAW